MSSRNAPSLEYAILGLLHGRAMSGYDVRKAFAVTPLCRYSDSPGAIYPALRRLEKAGLIATMIDAGKTLRPRKLCRLTPAGRAAFRAWLVRPIRRDDVVYAMDTLLLRFAFMGRHVTPPEIESFLAALREATRAYLGVLRAYAAEHRAAMPLTGRLALEHGLQAYEMHLRWIRRAIRDCQQSEGGDHEY